MRATAEHRAGHDVEEAWDRDGACGPLQRPSHHLQRGRGHHVAEQLDQVRVFWVGTDQKCFLSELIESVNTWLADQARLNTGYRLERVEYLEIRIPDPLP